MSLARLGDLVESCGGGTPSKSNPAYFGGSIPWITPKDMRQFDVGDSQVRLTELGLKNSPARRVPPASVLVVVRSGVLKHSLPVAVTNSSVTVNQDMRALIPGPFIDARYLAHLLRAQASTILGWVRATTADNFPFERLMDLEVLAPPLDEQRRIARILDVADQLRHRRMRAASALAELRDAALASTVLNTTGASVSTSLGECAHVQGGLQVSHARDAYEKRAPYLRVANVLRGRLDLGEIKTIGVTEAEAARCQLVREDLLFVEGHGNAEEVGRVGRWDGSIDGCVHQNHLIRARCDTRGLVPSYAEAYLNSASGRRTLRRAAKTTSGLNTITVNDVRKVPVVVPPIEDQERFAAVVVRIERVALSVGSGLDALDALYASLREKAFAGEL